MPFAITSLAKNRAPEPCEFCRQMTRSLVLVDRYHELRAYLFGLGALDRLDRGQFERHERLMAATAGLNAAHMVSCTPCARRLFPPDIQAEYGIDLLNSAPTVDEKQAPEEGQGDVTGKAE